MSTTKNIFIVDDDDIFVFLTKKMIKAAKRDTKIVEFSDGEQVLEFLKANIDNQDVVPDIIFLDINMPVTDGWGFLKAFAHLAPLMKKKVDIYVVSSSISPHDLEKAKQFKTVTDFVIKPLAKEKFISILDRV
jgi:CheY-like chemotaxis protein